MSNEDEREALEWDDVVDILSLCAAYDRRIVGDFDVQAWLDALTLAGVTSKDDAMSAVKMHHARSDEYCKPSHVSAGVKELRRGRLEHVDRILPKTSPDNPIAYRKELLAIRQATADGRITPPTPASLAIEGPAAGRLRAAIPNALTRRIPHVNPAVEGRDKPPRETPTLREPSPAERDAEEARRERMLTELARLAEAEHASSPDPGVPDDPTSNDDHRP